MNIPGQRIWQAEATAQADRLRRSNRKRVRPHRTVVQVDRRGWVQSGIMADHERTPGTMARRQAVRWSTAEERDLLAQVAEGHRLEDIATFHERSMGGVLGRLNRIYQDNDA